MMFLLKYDELTIFMMTFVIIVYLQISQIFMINHNYCLILHIS